MWWRLNRHTLNCVMYERGQSHHYYLHCLAGWCADDPQLLLCGAFFVLNSVVCSTHQPMRLMMVTISLILNIGCYGLNRVRQSSGGRMLCELCKSDSNVHGPHHYSHVYTLAVLIIVMISASIHPHGNMLIVIRKLFTFHLKCHSAVMSSVTYKMYGCKCTAQHSTEHTHFLISIFSIFPDSITYLSVASDQCHICQIRDERTDRGWASRKSETVDRKLSCSTHNINRCQLESVSLLTPLATEPVWDASIY